MTDILNSEQIADLVRTTETEVSGIPPEQPQRRYRYVRPLAQAAEQLIELTLNPEGRFLFGIQPLDIMVRGIGPGEMCMFIGRSHSSKTQVLLNSVANNPNARVLWCTPDEVAELVLLKLVSMVETISAEDLEKRLENKDEATMDMIRDVATIHFPNLVVVDEFVNVDQLAVALDEAESVWGHPADLVVYDYLELMPSADEGASGVTANAQALKGFAKDKRVPLAVVHQSSRSGGKRGEAAGMDGMRYGGEAESTYVIECYRKTQNESADEYERQQHAHTVTANVCKNKRPPCHTGQIDLYIHPNFGLVREIRDGDIGTPQEHAGISMRTAPSRGGGRVESMSDAMARIQQSRKPASAVTPLETAETAEKAPQGVSEDVAIQTSKKVGWDDVPMFTVGEGPRPGEESF